MSTAAGKSLIMTLLRIGTWTTDVNEGLWLPWQPTRGEMMVELFPSKSVQFGQDIKKNINDIRGYCWLLKGVIMTQSFGDCMPKHLVCFVILFSTYRTAICKFVVYLA